MVRVPAIVAAVMVLMAAVAQLTGATLAPPYWTPPSGPPSSPGVPSTSFPTSGWQDGSATYYGDDSGLGGDFGGACGYRADDISSLYSINTAALSTPLFTDGLGCGRCYEIRCAKSKWCVAGAPSVIVTGTNLCPPNWDKPNDNGGWCNPPRQHFDMAPPMFCKLADKVAGIVPVQFRRVPCQRSGGARFFVTGNDYWLLVYIMNLGGAGDVSSVSVRPANSNNWVEASQNWGVAYQAFTFLDHSVGLVISITTGTSPSRTIVCSDAIPAYWSQGLTYQATKNFS